MGNLAVEWVFEHVRGLEQPAEYALLFVAAKGCDDETGWLGWNRYELAGAVAVASRSFDRHYKKLAGLNLLIQGNSGFRLPAYLEWRRQIGGSCRQFAEKEKESTKEKERVLSSPDKFLKPGKSSVRTGPELRDRVMAGIARELRNHHNGSWVRQLSLQSLGYRELVFTYRGFLSPESIEELSRYLYQAADLSGHLRDRQIRLVVAAEEAAARSP